MNMAPLIQGERIAEYEVHGAFDIAVPVVVPAQVIVERVLRAQEVASHERGVVRRYPQRHPLLAQRARLRHRGRVLEGDVLGDEEGRVHGERGGGEGADGAPPGPGLVRRVAPLHHRLVGAGPLDGDERAHRRDVHLLRVCAGIDLDDDAGEVDERQRVDGGLDGCEGAGRRALVHHDRARGQERAVEDAVERAVPEAAHEPHPPRELPLDRLRPRRVHRVRLRGRVLRPRPQAPRVRVPLPVPAGSDVARRDEQRHGDAEQEPRPRRRGHRNGERGGGGHPVSCNN
uniref:Uncharacterized protein n=1 Tax=Arundo donax TaxID=35708 RepID=A0A0A9ERI7_ARUDO